MTELLSITVSEGFDTGQRSNNIPKVSPRAKLHLDGLQGIDNVTFLPDTQTQKLRIPEMSQKSGRGPAPLPRNSGAGSHTSSDEDHM